MCICGVLTLVGIALQVEFNTSDNCNPVAPLPGEALHTFLKNKALNPWLVTGGSTNMQLSLCLCYPLNSGNTMLTMSLFIPNALEKPQRILVHQNIELK